MKRIGLEDDTFTHGEVSIAVQKVVTIRSKAAVLASGGFPSDLEWPTRAWGPAAADLLIRGTPYNRGIVLKDMIEQGCEIDRPPFYGHALRPGVTFTYLGLKVSDSAQIQRARQTSGLPATSWPARFSDKATWPAPA